MFISKLTIQISSLYFMIILLTNTLLCGEVLENTQNEQIHNNNVNNNRTQSPNRNLYSSSLRGLYNRVTGPLFSFFRKTKEGVWYVKNKIKKDKPVVQTNHNPLKRVQEPLIAHRDNGFFLAEGIILYFLEFFCQNNFYIQDTDTQIIQKLTEKFKLFNFKRENKEDKKDEKEKKDNKEKKDDTAVVNDATTNSTTTDDNTSTTTDTNNSTTTDNNNSASTNSTTSTNNTTTTNNTTDVNPSKTFPSGIHLLTENCFENGFLKCKDSDHTKEIFDLIFADDDQISKLISIDEKILKNVITYKKKLTISENNKIVEFLNLLLKNKPNDTIDRINKSNRNGYNLIYPKCDSAFSLVVCFLKGVFEKIKMNYEENEKRYKQGDDKKEGGGQGLLGQNTPGQTVAGQGTPVHNNLGQGNRGQNTLSQTQSDQTLTNNYELPLVDNQNDSFRELAIF